MDYVTAKRWFQWELARNAAALIVAFGTAFVALVLIIFGPDLLDSGGGSLDRVDATLGAILAAVGVELLPWVSLKLWHLTTLQVLVLRKVRADKTLQTKASYYDLARNFILPKAPSAFFMIWWGFVALMLLPMIAAIGSNFGMDSSVMGLMVAIERAIFYSCPVILLTESLAYLVTKAQLKRILPDY